MEHLDLAGFIATPTHWTMPAFDQQDAVYLSSSRQMLEPILEETSEDEEHAQNNCSSYEQVSNVWSSAESETGSVIRIEVTKDADSISERDFACPAKRPRRSDECLNLSCSAQPTSLDDSVILRRFQRSNDAYDNNSFERFLACELQFGNANSRDSLGASSQQRSSTGSRRFDDFYSDSDSLSYHSLSRSSSLIQFESLERQMLQDQHSSLTSLGNSSPSVLSFEGACVGEETRKSNGDVGSSGGSGGNSGCNSGNNSRRGSQSSLLRRFESADGRLHQTYYDLDKLNFDDTEEKMRRIGASKSNAQTEVNAIAEVKSDSESSTSSSSSGNSILNASKPSAEDLTVNHSSTTAARIAAFQRGGGKNSAENLSEDSGYCEPSTLRRAKSKSIPKNFEKFCEEEEFFTEHEHKAIEAIDVVVNAYADDDRDEEDDDDDNDSAETRNTHSKNSTVIENDLCQPKIASLDSTFVVSSTSLSASTTIAPTDTHSSWLRYDGIKNSNAREPPSLSEHLAQYQPQQAHKQARSLAHSPSPVSDAGSTSSNASSSCASANSFTWLPTHSQPNSQHPQPQHPMMSLSNAQRYKQLPHSSPLEFSEQLRNSLPDIREANGSFGANYYSTPQKNSYVVDPPKERAPPHHRQQRTRTCSLTDSDTSSSSDSTTATSPAKSSSGHPSSEGNTTAKTHCGRVSSVPNELDKIGRSRRRGKTKYTKSAAQPASATASSESELTDEDFFDASNARSGRSCSWSENRGDTAQSFEATEGDRRKPLEAQSLGYMNASYHNLTLLDYSGHDPNKSQANGKRSSASKMESHKNSGDYESIICKGNFLLDELSEIYDRNASILNDQQLEAPPKLEVTATNSDNAGSLNPKAPPRLRKHSNSSHSDVDTADACERQVQHVQITLRKPPARQKHGRRQEAPSSLVSESSAGNFARTFDQDPTNLHTSYAQSLEKCNFDANELSISVDEQQSRSLPKRRFQSHAVVNKKRSLVSSTPNLNAFDPCGDEMEDDIYVSSAYNSMHQLPQGSVPKPLGILLPIGSRSSFGKGVSFCPVVSKYSWQEQSSEECNEPPTSMKGREEEESDDELLDNADATVIYNTKENEMIATRYAEAAAAAAAAEAPNQQRACYDDKEISVNSKEKETLRESETQQREPEQSKEQIEAKEEYDQGMEQKETEREERVCAVIGNKENIATAETSPRSNDNKRRAAQNEAAEKLVSSDRPTAEVVRSAVEPTLVSHKSTSNAVTSNQANEAPLTITLRVNNNANATTPRPVSLHLPILSEPPTNRAHILYASQQLIDNLAQEQQQQKARESVPPVRTQSAINLSPRQQQQVDSKVRVSRMSNLAIKCSESETVGAGLDQAGLKHYNNNNEVMKSKFKADEKHPSSKGFLSRFANGFRFSLRRNKKKLQQQQQQQQQQQPQQQLQQRQQSAEQQISNIRPAKNASTFFVSNGAKQKTGKQNSPDFIYIPLKGPRPADAATDYNVSISSSSSPSSTSANVTLSPSKPSAKQHVSQPALAPMVTGKPPLPKQPPRVVEKLPQLRHSAGGHAPHSAANFASHADQFYTSTKPTTIDEFFLESERSYYADLCRNQLASGMHANGRLLDTVSIDPTLAPTPTSQQFSSPSRASVSQKTQMFNNMSNGKVYVKNQTMGGGGGGGCKIGLIETNLDTHETVISGKTRSLMELGPQQHQQQRYKFIKRVNADASGGQTEIDDGYDDANDGDIEDVVTAADGSRSIVVVKGATQPAGQIASVRRPHKSMEFLLDKENQKNVLPPENELQKSHEHNPNASSEHQLRVQASLQRLNIPDWFRQYNQTTARSPDGGNQLGVGSYKPGNFTRKRTSESSGRWTGLNSKTTSLSSLGSQRSDRSPLLLSPSAHSHHGGQTSAGGSSGVHQNHAGSAATHAGSGGGGGAGNFSRWSTSQLNSSQTSPSCSQRGSFSRGGPVNSSFISVASGQSNASAVRSSFRQPYLGWRSQEKLSQPRTPHERLASSLLAAQQQQRPCSTPKTSSNGSVKQLPVTPEIQSSIKEVTSAIVHYVNDQTQQQRSRSSSPNSRKCWLESSFVGTRPLDSPQTPIIESTATFSATAAAAAAAAAATAGLNQFNSSNNFNGGGGGSSFSSSYYNNNSSATSSIYSATTSTNPDVLRLNGLSCGGVGVSVGVAPEQRSLSSASLEDVLASLLGLPTANTAGTGASASDAYTRSTTADSVSESLATLRYVLPSVATVSLKVDPRPDQRLRRRSESDAPHEHQKHPNQQQQQQQQQHHQVSPNAKPNQVDGLCAPPRRVSMGDDSSDPNKTTSELQIKCRNTKCDQSAPPADAKKYYKSCHNCSHLYCSRECRRAHWEKHRKACLHSRASNLCRQVLATCKDDLDSQRHLSLLARKGFLSQGRGVVRALFRSAESAEGFIKHGFQCMGEASYVRWPDLMPAEMGLELYSELLKLSIEYKPDSKMLIYVAICVVSEAPGTAQAPVKWERQLVSRCAKLKLCKTVLAQLDQQQQVLQLQQPLALVAVPEPATEILILTFNPSAHTTATRREVILSNILAILSRRGVFLRKHYPEIYQRLQTYTEGQADKFQPVTLHPRDSQTGRSFVCIIMPLQSESGIIKMPSVADGGNRVNTVDVGAANALSHLANEAAAQS